MASTRAKAVPKKALPPKARASNVVELRSPSERLRALEEAIEAVEKSYGDALEDDRTGPILVSPDALDIAREAVALRRWPALQLIAHNQRNRCYTETERQKTPSLSREAALVEALRVCLGSARRADVGAQLAQYLMERASAHAHGNVDPIPWDSDRLDAKLVERTRSLADAWRRRALAVNGTDRERALDVQTALDRAAGTSRQTRADAAVAILNTIEWWFDERPPVSATPKAIKSFEIERHARVAQLILFELEHLYRSDLHLDVVDVVRDWRSHPENRDKIAAALGALRTFTTSSHERERAPTMSDETNESSASAEVPPIDPKWLRVFARLDPSTIEGTEARKSIVTFLEGVGVSADEADAVLVRVLLRLSRHRSTVLAAEIRAGRMARPWLEIEELKIEQAKIAIRLAELGAH